MTIEEARALIAIPAERTAVSLRLTIPGHLPSLNDYTRSCRAHAQVGARMKRDAEGRIGWEIATQVKGRPMLSNVRVAFHWHESDRRRDPDNIAFGKKFILDHLVARGVLAGDGWEHVHELRDVFVVDAKNPRVEVIVTTMEEAGEPS